MDGLRVATFLLCGALWSGEAEASIINFSAFSGETGTPLVEYIQVVPPTRYRVTEAAGNVVFSNSVLSPSGNPRPGLAFVSGGLTGPALTSAITVDRFGELFELNGFELFTNSRLATYSIVGSLHDEVVLNVSANFQSTGFFPLLVGDTVLDAVTISVTPGFFASILDNIEVTAISTPPQIPEPLSSATLISGLIGIFLSRSPTFLRWRSPGRRAPG